jgi:hypothetical protein
VLLGAALVYFFFPKRQAEIELVDGYHRADAAVLDLAVAEAQTGSAPVVPTTVDAPRAPT